MAEYHVGCGAFEIYAGTLEPRNKSLWRNKSVVTQEALTAVARYLLLNSRELHFDYDSNEYVLMVDKVQNNESD